MNDGTEGWSLMFDGDECGDLEASWIASTPQMKRSGMGLGATEPGSLLWKVAGGAGLRLSSASGEAWLDSWKRSRGGGAKTEARSRGAGHPDEVAQSVRELAEVATLLPDVGGQFLDFRLVEELGRGAFGRVFLAKQGGLADRPVVLKIAAEVGEETQKLAQLQHTYIVPVYSVHAASSLQAFCMPYFGATTLAHVLSDLARGDALPQSGRHLLTTITERSRSREVERDEPSEDAAVSRADPAEPIRSRSPGRANTILRMFGEMSYVHSILWIVGCLAEGLAHAHERGILHRDLKPANILLTDEGRPMLLDFNLSESVQTASALASTSIGGTIPYMAPEHLDALRGGAVPVDARSDVYSLGVILYELLTGRSPFERGRGATLDDLIRDRSRLPENPRHWNPCVSPAVASIVLHCVEPDPRRRYQAAQELREDLDRQLSNLPLKYAPDRSIRERYRKWARRHPRLTSGGTIGAVAATFLIALSLGIGISSREARLKGEARAVHEQFARELAQARLVLNTSGVEPGRRQEGMVACRRALDRYEARDGGPPSRHPAALHLDPVDRDRLSTEVGESLWLLARATWLSAGESPGGPEAEADVRQALRLNHLAEPCFPPGRVPPTLWSQRAELARWLGRGEEAARWDELAGRTPPRTAQDLYMAASEHAARGRFAEAIPPLEEATRLDPHLYWAWLLKGTCHDREGQDVDALSCYQGCIVLEPDAAWSYFNRGLVWLRRGEFRRALADFGAFIDREPARFEGYLDRSLAWQGLGRHAEALRDVDAALDRGAPGARCHFMKARMLRDNGDVAGSHGELRLGMSFTPTDEPSWIARGLARAESDPPAALDDFREALALNPRSLAALQNTASILADQPGRMGEAVQALSRALSLFPDYVPARSGRGVLLARLGRRDAAVDDAEESLRRDTSPATLYQVAGIYARTSEQCPDDRLHAVRLLAAALRSGYGSDQVEGDRDLDPIRQSPEFRDLIRSTSPLERAPVGPADLSTR